MKRSLVFLLLLISAMLLVQCYRLFTEDTSPTGNLAAEQPSVSRALISDKDSYNTPEQTEQEAAEEDEHTLRPLGKVKVKPGRVEHLKVVR